MQYVGIQTQQSRNNRRSVLLLFLFPCLVAALLYLACYLLADHMDWRSPNRYAYLSEMGGLAAYADLLLPARHGIASPSSMPALWKAKLTDGYTPDSYGYVTYPRRTGAAALSIPPASRRTALPRC